MSDEIPLETSLPKEATAKIKDIVGEVLSRRRQATTGEKATLPIPLSLTPLGPLELDALHYEEVLVGLRRIIQGAPSSQAQASIGAKASNALTGEVRIRPHVEGTLSITGSVTPRLIDPATSKKFWESPSGWEILTFIAMVFIFCCQEYRLDIREAEGENIMREIVKQFEEFWLVHKDQPQPTRTPTPDTMGD